jgi:hypothetical protein
MKYVFIMILKGYSKSNVVLCCYGANCGRANCSIDDWKRIISIIRKGLNEKNTTSW